MKMPYQPRQLKKGQGRAIRRSAVGAELAIRACEMRAKGMRYEDIAREVGKSKGAVWAIIWRAYSDRMAPAVEAAREYERDVIDAVQLANYDKMLAGDPQAAQIVLGCSDRRRKLYGLDAPAQAPVDQDGNAVPITIEVHYQDVPAAIDVTPAIEHEPQPNSDRSAADAS